MDSDALATFLAVCEGGFSGAARKLGRTQPAISHRIRMLEQELGVSLFERTGGAVALSQAGRALKPHAEKTLAALADAEAAVRSLSRAATGEVGLAVVGTLATSPLTEALRQVTRAHPGLDLRLCTARSAEVSELVRRGDAVLGLRYQRGLAGDLEVETLAEDPLVVVSSPDHPLAGRRLERLRQLEGERWVAFSHDPASSEAFAAHVAGVFAGRGLAEIDWIAIDSLTAQKRLVEAGFGIALTPRGNVAEEIRQGALAQIGVADLDVAVEIALVRRRGGYMSQAALVLCEALRACLKRRLPAKTKRRRHRR